MRADPENLERMPYVAARSWARLAESWSRSRLMGLGAGAEVPRARRQRIITGARIVRIHVPIITDPKVLFTCGDETVHMARGECWTVRQLSAGIAL